MRYYLPTRRRVLTAPTPALRGWRSLGAPNPRFVGPPETNLPPIGSGKLCPGGVLPVWNGSAWVCPPTGVDGSVTNPPNNNLGPGPTGPPIMNVPPDGTLIKASGDEVDIMQNGQRRWIPDPTTFACMGLSWNNVQIISDAQFASIPQGPQMPALTCAPGTVVNPPPPTIIPPSPGIPPNGTQPPGACWQQVEDPGNPFPYVYICGGTPPPVPGAVPPGPASWPGGIPPGSYQLSSKNIQVIGDTLTALCENGQGQWVPSQLTGISACVASGADISNQNGVLTCGGAPSPVYYPSTAALNVPMPGGGVLNPASLPAAGSSFGSQLSNFFSQYGLYVGLGLAAIIILPKVLGGGRK
jgi:hypothetical protein